MKKENIKPKKEKDPAAKIANIRFVLVVVASFIAALCFRQSMGIVAMFPISILIWGGIAWIGMESKGKITVCVAMTFTLNTLEQSDMNVTLRFTALCLLCCVAFEFAAKALKKHKKYGYGILGGGAVVCIALSFLLVGNPFGAISAMDAIEEYTDTKYPQNSDSVLGEFEFSGIYYLPSTGAYAVEVTSSAYPTETGILTYSGSLVSDSFETLMEEKVAEPYVLEITTLLRDVFPNHTFSVSYDSIATLPNENALSAGENELYGDIVFEIYLSGVQTANVMLDRVEHYTEIIDNAGIEYSKIIFKSGTGEWVRRSVTVSGSSRGGFASFELERVPTGTSNKFNRYIMSTIDLG